VPQEEPAHRLGLTPSRLNDLLRGKLSKFYLGAHVNIFTAARVKIEIRVTAAA
jgi:predicted XRE-type DNA-binding protein